MSRLILALISWPSLALALQSSELETMRYRHLWIAYGLIWLFSFLFIRSTWRRLKESERSLESLKARVQELEER